MTLRGKIYAATGAATLIAFLAMWGLIHHEGRAARVSAAEASARLMVAQADVTDRYTREQVAPLLDRVAGAKVVFIPQSTGFFTIESEARLLGDALPGYGLRRVVLDSTGVTDGPDSWERDAIMRLRGEKKGEPYSEIRAPGRLSYVMPLTMSDGVCATCYTSKASAPIAIRDAFGTAHGFDRKAGEIVGATIATVPVPPAPASETTCVLLAALVIAALAAVFCAVVEVALLRPLSRIAAVAEHVSLGVEGVEEFDTREPGELGALALSFNRLRRSMESAIALVES
ncbi:HAMP domain-containing protein [Ameyamaea chiangmaiensis NBRC 103196]|uniref:DUF3365 domain-containing protein n=1 Tax=Ameyamaea chiangmaiensis TaxID=442969 RepID=A0A850PCF2_9PROT|nr:DUF3365 domain-containing protein [Ameyamaea chiangmaiensis]MBS4076107.1 DUF3365 domain-containing protein [Ameyamaea chiangmaiensis]NVN39622.1 DUF3365 domain-containing protein [Ameyamaea chiangmaiensis]GBQ67041.1 HAMP domain-containing protein [Ameyamaea chiangmaiensis NBRC 103196]